MMALRQGNQDAARNLWERYYARLVRLVRHHLRSAGLGGSLRIDDENAALEAFRLFCAAQQDGRFPELSSRRQLWPLLVTITQTRLIATASRIERLKPNVSSGTMRMPPPSPRSDPKTPAATPPPIITSAAIIRCDRKRRARESRPGALIRLWAQVLRRVRQERDVAPPPVL